MTNQEIFDQVTTHLLTQMKRSSKNGCCLYRGPDNTKCAIGCLIKDEDYKPQWDENSSFSVSAIYNQLPDYLKDSSNDGQRIRFLSYLQNTHDSTHPQYWEESLKITADIFSLKFNWIDS